MPQHVLSERPDLPSMTHLRPAEIKTYHQQSYDRISPSKTFDGKGKTVLVTAGATGVGYSIAHSFAQSGVEHVVLIQRRQTVLQKAKQSLQTEFPNLKVTIYADSVNDLDRMTSILQGVGKVDVLVPNAGVSHAYAPSKDIPLPELQNTFDVNVISTFHLIKEFLALNTSGPRTIIYTSSCLAYFYIPGSMGYNGSKAAANLMIQHFANDCADAGVTAQVFHPGAINTESARDAFGEDALDWEDPKLPGDFAVWLASEEAKFLAGRMVWAQWDVDELLSMKERLASNPALLTMSLIL